MTRLDESMATKLFSSLSVSFTICLSHPSFPPAVLPPGGLAHLPVHVDAVRVAGVAADTAPHRAALGVGHRAGVGRVERGELLADWKNNRNNATIRIPQIEVRNSILKTKKQCTWAQKLVVSINIT